ACWRRTRRATNRKASPDERVDDNCYFAAAAISGRRGSYVSRPCQRCPQHRPDRGWHTDALLMGMTPLRMLGIVLVVLGLASLAYQGVTYTTREKIFDIGPISATTERTQQ